MKKGIVCMLIAFAMLIGNNHAQIWGGGWPDIDLSDTSIGGGGDSGGTAGSCTDIEFIHSSIIVPNILYWVYAQGTLLSNGTVLNSINVTATGGCSMSTAEGEEPIVNVVNSSGSACAGTYHILLQYGFTLTCPNPLPIGGFTINYEIGDFFSPVSYNFSGTNCPC